VRATLYAKADGEKLTAAERGALEAHVGRCPECAAEFRRASEFTTRIGELLGSLRPPVDLGRKVLDRIGADSPRMRVALGATALAAVLAAGLVLLALAGREPVMEIGQTRGDVRVLVAKGLRWEPRAGASGVRARERLSLGEGAYARLTCREGTVELTGPALAQVEVEREGFMVLHLLRRTRLSAAIANAGFFQVRIDRCAVRAGGSEFDLDVDPAGAAELRVRAGRATAVDASGTRSVGPGETARLAQPAASEAP